MTSFQDTFSRRHFKTHQRPIRTSFQDTLSRHINTLSRHLARLSTHPFKTSLLSRHINALSRHFEAIKASFQDTFQDKHTVVHGLYNFATANVHVVVHFQYRTLVVDYIQKICTVLWCRVRHVPRPDTSAKYVRNPSRLQECK